MKKSTKVIATVIAVTLVITAMLVAIYAATAGNANISANVSWTAQAGVNLEFWAKATGGDESKEIAKTTITPTTTNTDANIIGDLSCNFTDTTDDGVNNPNAIKFTYYVRNKSLTPLNIRVTKTPAEAEESGTRAENHKPKVTLNSETDGTSTLTAVSSNLGYNLKAGDIFTYSVTLSLAKGGTGTINADFGLAPNFDAGVTFNFNVGGDNNGRIVTSVDGASPTTVSSSTLAGQTLGEYLATQQTAEYSTGWFFDEGLTKVVSDDYLNDSLKGSSISSFYCKTASIDGLKFTLSDDGNSYLVEGESKTSPSGEVVIPNIYNGKPVSGFVAGTNYSTSAFKQNKNITSVILRNTITVIADYAFCYLSSIVSVAIPNSVTNIGNSAFSNCSGLTNITIPNGVISIENFTFYNCSSLTSIEIPDSVTSIGGSVFSKCSKLINVTIGNGVTSIGDGTFSYCNSLISIKIPQGVTVIKSNLFYQCGNLTSIEIPNSVTSIGQIAFKGCSNLTSIELPNGITSIEYGTFSGCSGLTKIFIPKSMTEISVSSSYNSPFYNCSSTLKIYCEASEKPSGWVDYWNYYNSSNQLNVTWGVTRAEYDAL